MKVDCRQVRRIKSATSDEGRSVVAFASYCGLRHHVFEVYDIIHAGAEAAA